MSEYHKPDLHIVQESSVEDGRKYKEIVVKSSDPKAWQDLAGDLSEEFNGAAERALENQWIVELPPEGGKKMWGLTDLGVAEKEKQQKNRKSIVPDMEAGRRQHNKNLFERASMFSPKPLSSQNERPEIKGIDPKTKKRRK